MIKLHHLNLKKSTVPVDLESPNFHRNLPLIVVMSKTVPKLDLKQKQTQKPFASFKKFCESASVNVTGR